MEYMYACRITTPGALNSRRFLSKKRQDLRRLEGILLPLGRVLSRRETCYPCTMVLAVLRCDGSAFVQLPAMMQIVLFVVLLRLNYAWYDTTTSVQDLFSLENSTLSKHHNPKKGPWSCVNDRERLRSY